MSWTEEKVEKLKELWGKGNTASQIAEIIGGISRNAVIGKAHRLNLSAKIKTRSSSANQKNYKLNEKEAKFQRRGRRNKFKSLIIEKDPELIIVGHKESFDSRLENRPNWSNISAVKNEKIIYLEENLANNWGTSSVDLLEELAIQTGAIEKEENNTKQIFYWWFYIVVIISSVLIMNSRTRKTKEYS